MRRKSLLCTLTGVLALLALPAGATTLAIALDIQGSGLAIADGGVGLTGIGGGTANLSVNIGGPVQAALLYWAGRDRPCPQAGESCVIPSQPYKDQVLSFDGNLVTGTIIGTETQPVSGDGPINDIGYLADVTSIVQAKGTGPQVFAVGDGDTSSNLFRLDGAGLLVIYTDPVDTTVYRLTVFDGLDFADGADPTPGGTQVTTPVTFNHGTLGSSRTATLRLFVGDAAASRDDEVEVTNNASVPNGLDASDGSSWDTDALLVNIPPGVESTTVGVLSEAMETGNPTDSLLWQVAALRVALEEGPPPGMGCGPGYWRNHTDAWPPTGYSTSQKAVSVFSQASAFPALGNKTLLQTLGGKGGPGPNGGAQILLRAAVAALLDASHPGVNYPRTTADVIADVNAALASGDRETMILLAYELDNDNDLGCPLH